MIEPDLSSRTKALDKEGTSGLHDGSNDEPSVDRPMDPILREARTRTSSCSSTTTGSVDNIGSIRVLDKCGFQAQSEETVADGVVELLMRLE
jgi:hypothetical protein